MIVKTTPTDEDGYTTYEITEDGSGKEYFEIHLKNGTKLTLDTDSGQIYYTLIPDGRTPQDQILQLLHRDIGLTVLNFDLNEKRELKGIEIVP